MCLICPSNEELISTFEFLSERQDAGCVRTQIFRGYTINSLFLVKSGLWLYRCKTDTDKSAVGCIIGQDGWYLVDCSDHLHFGCHYKLSSDSVVDQYMKNLSL